MMLGLILAATLISAEKPQLPNDLRTFCSSGGAIKQEASKAGTGSTAINVSNRKQRAISLPSGHHVIVQRTKEGLDELLVEENGKYRRIVSGHSKVQHIAPSKDGKYLAVVVVHDEQMTVFDVPNAGLYLFETATWQGEQIVKLFGYSGLAWSPDSKTIAYGDHAKVRLFDVVSKGQLEMCGVDSAATDDGKERVKTIGWLADRQFRFTYQNPRGNTDFKVTLP